MTHTRKSVAAGPPRPPCTLRFASQIDVSHFQRVGPLSDLFLQTADQVFVPLNRSESLDEIAVTTRGSRNSMFSGVANLACFRNTHHPISPCNRRLLLENGILCD
jgi:hypothetical protein